MVSKQDGGIKMEYSEKISLRVAFGNALVKAGETRTDLRVFDAGTKNSTMSLAFERAYPDRFYTAGINEPGMMGLATGLAMDGKPVVACDMSVFLHHAYAQIRAAVRQGKDLHMIIAASHTGVAVGPDGGSAHDITDMARMRLIPNMQVLTPMDGNQVNQAVQYALNNPGFYYIRLNRPAVPIFTEADRPFEFAKAHHLADGNKITIIAAGDKAFTAMEASEQLGEGVADVIGISTLEPLDADAIIQSAEKTGKVITIEDHMYVGGLFESVAGVLALKRPTPMARIALGRILTTSGEPDELARIYKVDLQELVERCKQFIGDC